MTISSPILYSDDVESIPVDEGDQRHFAALTNHHQMNVGRSSLSKPSRDLF